MAPRANTPLRGSDPPAKAPEACGVPHSPTSLPPRWSCRRTMPFPMVASRGGSAAEPVSRFTGRHPAGDAPCELARLPWGWGGPRKHGGGMQEPPARAAVGDGCVYFGGGDFPKKVAFWPRRKLKTSQWVKPCQIKQTGEGKSWKGKKESIY